MIHGISSPSWGRDAGDVDTGAAADLVLWCGPVAAQNLGTVRWRRPTHVLTVNEGIGGFGSSHFAALGAALGARPLSALADRAGRSLVAAPRVAILGFSAAHGLLEAILRSPDADRVSALGAFDAYYTSHTRQPKPGYLAFCRRAATGGALAIVTTSGQPGGPGPDGQPLHPSGRDSFAPLAAELGQLGPVSPPSSVPPGASVRGRAGFLWADYDQTHKHVQHATTIGPTWTDALIAPALARSAETGDDLAVLAVLTALGFAVLS
jgi:hypothetical protein